MEFLRFGCSRPWHNNGYTAAKFIACIPLGIVGTESARHASDGHLDTKATNTEPASWPD
jgi:hypothetical protein